jgi:hypothetical protein
MERLRPSQVPTRTFNTVNSGQQCKVREIGPANAERAFIGLSPINHLTHYVWGFVVEEILQRDGKFVTFHWPKERYDHAAMVDQVSNYIGNSLASEVIVGAMSYGEVVARDVLAELSAEEQKKIKAHLSICGVATAKELKPPEFLVKFASEQADLLRQFPFLKRLFLKTQVLSPRKWDDWPKATEEERAEIKRQYHRHERCAAIAITPSYRQRLARLLSGELETSLETRNYPFPTIAFYTDGDDLIRDEAAQRIVGANRHQESRRILVPRGNHASLVERPMSWRSAINPVLDRYWKKDS